MRNIKTYSLCLIWLFLIWILPIRNSNSSGHSYKLHLLPSFHFNLHRRKLHIGKNKQLDFYIEIVQKAMVKKVFKQSRQHLPTQLRYLFSDFFCSSQKHVHCEHRWDRAAIFRSKQKLIKNNNNSFSLLPNIFLCVTPW